MSLPQSKCVPRYKKERRLAREFYEAGQYAKRRSGSLPHLADFGIGADLAQKISPLRQLQRGLPPTLILIGSKDKFLGQNRQFIAKGQQVGTRMELDIAEGQPHAYFNRSPWMEKTVASADRFLISLGYVDKQPQVELPTIKKTPR